LDSIPGIGPATKKKLLKHFGSVKAIKTISLKELTDIVGKHRAQIISQYLSK
jgi:excinuclease ABC subunit C